MRTEYLTKAKTALLAMGIKGGIEELRTKDGISLFRVYFGGRQAVLKYFHKAEFSREITNYQLLKEAGLNTLPVIAKTENAILLEDLQSSPKLRLATKDDLNLVEIAAALAGWYKELHGVDAGRLIQEGFSFYSELDFITTANLHKLIRMLGNDTPKALRWVEAVFDELQALLSQARKTLTYNDFYYTNLAVARDGKAAFMFDYNLLGLGFPAMDLRNVTSSMNEEAGKAFLRAYGPVDPLEVKLNEIISPITGLLIGMERKPLPPWFYEELEEINTIDFQSKLQSLLGI